MAYEFDVFLSYSRANQWPDWVKDHFLPIFQHWLGEELGKPPRIFVDYEIKAGTTWPLQLDWAHARSRVVVALWSGNYFSSKWCVIELARMRARELSEGFRSAADPNGLIVPFKIADGKHIPESAKKIQFTDISEWVNPCTAQGGPTAESLSDAIRTAVQSVSRAIDIAPTFREEWDVSQTDAFIREFQIARPQQLAPPKL